MSHWVYLTDANGEALAVGLHEEGGTYVMGGNDSAELNVTYNYSKFIHPFIEGGLHGLHGMIASESIPLLEQAVDCLGTDRDRDYWLATPGNAGHALNVLLSWARLWPDGIWEVH